MKLALASLALPLLLLGSPAASAQRASLAPAFRPLQGVSPFTPGNLLVSHGGRVREYTRTGALRQELEVPHPDTTRHDVCDIVVDLRGRLHVLNIAPFAPSYLSSFDPLTGLWEHHPVSAFLGNVSDGDLALLGDTAFTKSVAISLADFTTRSIPPVNSGSGGETAAGETGLLYALDGGSPRWRVHVRDPSTFAVLRTLELFNASGSRLDQRGVAVLPSGELFAADWDGRIYRYDPDGNLVTSVSTGAFNLLNIDLARDGALVVGSRFGDVIVTDTSLASVQRFSVGGGLVYVAFVPEPLEEVGFELEDDHLTTLVNGQDVSGAEEFGRLLRVDGWSSNGLSAAIFDSSPAGPNAGGQDRDLLVDRGNLLILQGRPGQSVPGRYDVPDDHRYGGDLVLDFLDRTVAPRSIDLVDIELLADPQDVTLTLVDVLGRRRTYAVPGGWTEDVQADGPPGYRTLDLTTLADQPGFLATATATQEAGFCADAVSRIEIHVSGSGAIDGFVFFP